MRVFVMFLCMGLQSIQGQSKDQRKQITDHYDYAAIQSLKQEFKNSYKAQKLRLSRHKAITEWPPSKQRNPIEFSELQDIGPDGTLLYYTTFNDNVSHTSRANALYKDGLLQLGIAGEGMRVGVWDAGVALSSHQEFGNRVRNWDATEKVGSHATMVTGTLLAAGVKRKATGVAYKATAITSDWSKDKMEVLEAAADGLLLSNHSYGINPANVPDWYFGAYLQVSQDWDKIMYSAPYYLMVTAAGNAQRLNHNQEPMYGNITDGFDLLLGFATAKNAITVAAANTEIDTNGLLLNASVSGYSSFGPTDDGRIKPDIASVGSTIYSSDSKSNKSYRTTSGTSMATPGVTASMLLLQQYYEQLYGTYMKAATLKGLVLHSADDVNQPGPDYQMGWGVMNTKKAAEILMGDTYNSLIVEEQLSQEEVYSITINASGLESLIASISWTDPAGVYTNSGDLNKTTPALMNDLDLRITKDGNTYYPWKLNPVNANAKATRGDNQVDPFEKIEIENPTGVYTITVAHKGDLSAAMQHFSLIVSGVQLSPCELIAPTGISLTEEEAAVVIHWDAIPEASYSIAYRQGHTEEWQTAQTSQNFYTISDLIEEMDYELKVQSVCTQTMVSEYSTTMGFTYVKNQTLLKDLGELQNIENSTALKLSMYPNPATNQLYVEGDFSGQAAYLIRNTSGIKVKQGKVSEPAIQISNLASGMYFITVMDMKGSRTAKFYKN